MRSWNSFATESCPRTLWTGWHCLHTADRRRYRFRSARRQRRAPDEGVPSAIAVAWWRRWDFENSELLPAVWGAPDRVCARDLRGQFRPVPGARQPVVRQRTGTDSLPLDKLDLRWQPLFR